MKGFLCIWLLSGLLSCKKEPVRDNPVPPAPNPPAVSGKSYLALGDSYTIGQGVPALESFPVQARNLFVAEGIAMENPRILAQTGWTTGNLKSAIQTSGITGTFDLVTLLIGVNDQYQFRDTTGYRDRFRELLLTAIGFSGNRHNHVAVLSIPDYSVTPFAANSDTATIRRQIDWFNNINRELTLQQGCAYIDITPSTREARNNLALIAGDGLHPSGIEYRKWATRLVALMKPVLQ